jgi:hypothetical protein
LIEIAAKVAAGEVFFAGGFFGVAGHVRGMVPEMAGGSGFLEVGKRKRSRWPRKEDAKLREEERTHCKDGRGGRWSEPV